jgi:hypothetical protein
MLRQSLTVLLLIASTASLKACQGVQAGWKSPDGPMSRQDQKDKWDRVDGIKLPVIVR